MRADIRGISPELIRAKRRIGQRMVLIYLAVYAFFVGVHVLWPQVPESPCAGLSVGLVAGVLMMAFAVLMALAYHLLCNRAESRLNSEQ